LEQYLGDDVSKYTGGPVFPIPAQRPSVTHDGQVDYHTPFIPAREGMSLRDYFAAAALQGIFACEIDHEDGSGITERCELAYEYADAMIATRDVG
jgi:hypothetical protein